MIRVSAVQHFVFILVPWYWVPPPVPLTANCQPLTPPVLQTPNTKRAVGKCLQPFPFSFLG